MNNNNKNDIPISVRLRLGDILKKRKITQTQFAKMSGLSRQTISSLVHQPTQIRFDTISALCYTLVIDIDELFEFE